MHWPTEAWLAFRLDQPRVGQSLAGRDALDSQALAQRLIDGTLRELSRPIFWSVDVFNAFTLPQRQLACGQALKERGQPEFALR